MGTWGYLGTTEAYTRERLFTSSQPREAPKNKTVGDPIRRFIDPIAIDGSFINQIQE